MPALPARLHPRRGARPFRTLGALASLLLIPCAARTQPTTVASAAAVAPDSGTAPAAAPASTPASATVTGAADRPRLTLTADLLAATAFVWRGVTTTNRPVLGPTVTLAAPLPAGITGVAGAWGNIEPAAYTGPHDLSTYGGARGPLLTSSQVWVEARHPMPADGTFTLGATAYHYPNVGELARSYDTGELYAVAAGGGAFAPSLGVWVDAWKVRGAYAEAGLSHGTTVPAAVPGWLGRGRTVTLGATLGFSAGDGASDGTSAYFAGNGLTHADLSATTEVGLGAIAILPTAHLVLGRDPMTRIVAPDATRATKLWVGASLHWTGAVRAARRVAAGPAAERTTASALVARSESATTAVAASTGRASSGGAPLDRASGGTPPR